MHRHLDGNIRVQSIVDLGRAFNVTLPSADVDELKRKVYIQDKTSDLLAFLQKIDLGVSVLGDLDACRRIAFENVEDAVTEGLHHVELRFSPYYMSRAFNLPLEGVVEAVVEGVQAANATFNFNAKLIGILSRTFGQHACMQELDALLSFSANISAIDLAGDEKSFPARLFIKHFNKVKDAGLGITIHAGEADGPESVWDAIKLLHADRIGHGVMSYKDPNLLAYLSENQVGVESCLLSNYQTGTWTSMEQHPLKTFLSNQIPVFLNTDDPGVSNNTLQGEYALAKLKIGLSDVQIKQLQLNAFNQSFLTAKEKDALRASFSL